MAKKKQVEEPISEEVMVGKKPRLSASQKESIPKEHEAGATGKELAEKYGCTIGTIYNIIKKSG
jgi:Mor family transcriptional regulator